MSSRHIVGPFKFSTVKNLTEAGDYTVVNESVVLVNKASGAATTINLPAVSSTGARRSILVVDAKGDAATNNITIDASASETINGAATYVLSENYGSVLLIDDGAEWIVAAASNVIGGDEAALLNGLVATATEINRTCDVSTRIVDCTSSTLTVTEAAHDGKTIVLDRAAGIAVTLPSASAGLRFEFIVKTTFTGAATIKSVVGTDIMIGHAIMGNNTDNSVVNWQATAGDTFDTIDMLGTSNSTGGMAGQRIRITGLAAARWYVEIIGDAAGTEATPFANTVA